MHVMEDVHEGCNTQQPSSPGHAEQRQDLIKDMCKKELEDAPSESPTHVNMTEIKHEDLQEPPDIKIENVDNHNGVEMNGDLETNHINEDSSNDNDSCTTEVLSLKRKLEAEANESAMKRLHVDLQRSFAVRDKFLKKCLESIGGNNFEQIQGSIEQILTEIRALGELAKQKEKEWNNILHFKKLKEELLLRLERQKQLLLLNLGDFDEDSANDTQRSRNILHSNQKQKNFNGRAPYSNSIDLGGTSDYRQRMQRPVVDVKSIIADYRQKHPETVPRRGRRIRSNLPQNVLKSSGNVLNVSSMALGSGAQVLHNTPNNDVNLQHTMENDMTNDLTSFKDMLVEFAKLSQSEKQDILRNNNAKPPPPYPEVTVHPVPTTSSNSNSLLHGILTKNQPAKPETKTTFSPTLARLLTAPEKSSPQQNVNHNLVMSQGNVASISDILSHSKARNEITITPVVGKYDGVMKSKNHMDEDEQEDSVDRLVIDEGGEAVDGRSKDNNSDMGDDVPQCQGCNQRQAQFVCAGCGNQWYCSRDCQVAAWDEHSEVCSG